PIELRTHGRTKQLLADAVRDVLPPALLHKPKTGFELPMREWLTRGALRPWLDLLVSDDLALVRAGILDAAAVRKVRADFLRGKSHYMKPWSIIVFENWFREF